MKVLIIGNGGREHALAWKFSKDKNVKKIYIAPGNAGTENVSKCKNIDLKEIMEMVDFAQKNNIEYIDSCTNFITYIFNKFNSTDIANRLLRRGIIVRDLMPSYEMNAIRVTIGTTIQNSRFFEEFTQLLENGEDK